MRRKTFDDEPSLPRASFKETPKKEFKYAFKKMRTKLDDDTIEEIGERLFGGESLPGIADSLCINSGSLYKWKQYGEAYNESSGGDRNPHHEIYGRFVIGIRAALGDYKQDIVKQIHERDNREWRRPFSIAERRDPQAWGVNPRGGSDEDYQVDEQFL